MDKHMNRRSAMRRNFGLIPSVIDMPNLIDVQRTSYDQFLQRDVPEDDRLDEGLEGVFRSVFPIRDFSDRADLEFVRYQIEAAEEHGGRVPAAGPHLCGAAQGSSCASCSMTSTGRSASGRSAMSRSRTSTWATFRS